MPAQSRKSRPDRTVRDVVFVDGVRTPFGKAGAKGMYAETRADDLVVTVHPRAAAPQPGAAARAHRRGRDRRHHPDRRPGPDHRPHRRAAGRPAQDRARLRHRPDVRRRDDRGHHRRRRASRSAPTTSSIAGGVEHMGHHPMGEGVDPNPRFVAEKLVDPSALVMGATAENLHDRFPHLTKERADAFARRQPGEDRQGLRRRQDPARPGAGRDPQRRAGLGPGHRGRAAAPGHHARGPRRRSRRRSARTAGSPPGNAAGLNDGATACLLAAEDVAARARPAGADAPGVFALRRRRARGHGRRPDPVHREGAARKAGLTIDDIGLFELNEAFAVQVLAFLDHFGIADDDPRVNPYGGAIAVGHPLASSGVRLMTQLARQFAEHPEVRYGLTAMCIGLGMGGTVIWENPHYDRHERRGVTRRDDMPAASRTRSSRRRSCATSTCPGGAGTAALITLDNGLDHTKPNTFGPAGLRQPRRRARRGARRATDVVAVAVTGKPFIFAVGADLNGDAAGRTPRAGAASIGRARPPGLPPAAATRRSRRSRSSTARRWAAASRSRCTATTAPSPPACRRSRCPRSSSAWSPAGAAA